jgi:tellurite methyltransferase
MNARDKWNRKYVERISHDKETFPNPNLEKLTDYLSGGKALDLACGLGGNSVFLAGRNFQVDALDLSEVAVDFVQKQAEKYQLTIKAQVCDLSNLAFLKKHSNSVNLVVLTYYLDRQLFPVLKEVVQNGGYLFIETYYQTPVKGNKSVSNRYKLEPQELLTTFSDWKVLLYEENEWKGIQTIFCQKG